jgi:hypothetical protein
VEESLRCLVHLYRQADLRKSDEFAFAFKSKDFFDVVVFVHFGIDSTDVGNRILPFVRTWIVRWRRARKLLSVPLSEGENQRRAKRSGEFRVK